MRRRVVANGRTAAYAIHDCMHQATHTYLAMLYKYMVTNDITANFCGVFNNRVHHRIHCIYSRVLNKTSIADLPTAFGIKGGGI